MTRQEHYRHRFSQDRHGQWRDCLRVLREVVDPLVTADSVVLDIGCGHADFLRDILERTTETYGIDPDPKAIARNTILRHVAVTTAEDMTFPDGMFDVVLAVFVFEHVTQPEIFLQQVSRVLKPGGHVVFLTPNAWNYNVWLIRMIPNRWHEMLTRWLYHRQEHDTFPVRYRMNNPRRLAALFRRHGLRLSQTMNGDPTYLSFTDWQYRWWSLVERWHDISVFRRFRVHIIGDAVKLSLR